MIDEFSDVNEGEKELMKMWNLHIQHYTWVWHLSSWAQIDLCILISVATVTPKTMLESPHRHTCLSSSQISKSPFWNPFAFVHSGFNSRLIATATNISLTLENIWEFCSVVFSFWYYLAMRKNPTQNPIIVYFQMKMYLPTSPNDKS